ncbi:MAG: bifunctional phosphoribosyl-AMP cyclohydrolase/phosphoribosyl-ATP diphosphatase HisIE [Lachnospiraceae bacterium]|nr:bifunctional phosphoribosyl-AMP cyclohydrolase/phosphoribosyl-ATP diphosphatase HisIE [Lachnospiraceae bacterium]
MSEVKKFAAVIYLDKGKAVKNRMDLSPLKDSPEELAHLYSDLCADEIVVFDLSESDAEHEEAIGCIKRICASAEVPVSACGNVKRFEDVKKLIYAGCARAGINISKASNLELLAEAAGRFGKEKLFACVKTAEELTAFEKYEESVSELALLGGDDDHYSSKNAAAILDIAKTDVMLPMPDAQLSQIVELLKKDKVSGLYGPIVNSNVRELNSIKAFCSEAGVTVKGFDAKLKFSDLKTGPDGLVPVICQDYRTKEVLMMAYMNEAAFEATIHTGRMTYYSRSRKSQWVKGETSGHFQYLKSLYADCDRDTLLAGISQVGAACHTGKRSCFFEEIVKKNFDEKDPSKVFTDVYDVIMDRKQHPKEGSYTNYLFDKGIDKMLKKLGEECTEIVIAAKNPDPEEIKYEISDLLYHMMVLMAEKGVTWEDICRELASR